MAALSSTDSSIKRGHCEATVPSTEAIRQICEIDCMIKLIEGGKKLENKHRCSIANIASFPNACDLTKVNCKYIWLILEI